MTTAPADGRLTVAHQAGPHASRRRSDWITRHYNPAAAVYGIVICSAVLAIDAGLGVRTISTVESVAGALIIYWLAEAYAHLVTAPPAQGGARAWAIDARRTLADQAALVLAPLLLIAVLLATRFAGASPTAADIWALISGIALLGAAGARGATRAGRTGASVIAAALLGASFGVAAILLKIVIHSAH